MSTRNHDALLDGALAAVAKPFRAKIISTYIELKRNCLEGRHEAAGMAAGKLCEIVLRLLQDRVFSSHTPFGQRITNFADECRRLVGAPATTAIESERVVIPRALLLLYTIRNKRGIGHVGGDVDANEIDAATMARVADWLVCELIRIHHGLSMEEAQDLIDGISIRQVPTIWEVAGKRRVLRDGLSAKDQVLLLLYSSKETAVFVEDLCEWIEYSNPHVLKSRILGGLHHQRLIEYDRDTETATLSPKGADYVEKHIL